jgi:uncharacterized membrane protein
MFGFVLGTACLFGLIYMLKRPHLGHGRRSCGRSPLYAAFEHLDTSPGQEKVIRDAVDELFERGRDFKQDVRRSRQEFAQALRSDTLDEAVLSQLFERHESNLGELRSTFVAALRKVHETLDDRQRRRLADWLESSWGFGHGFRRHGPYR